MPRLLDQRLVGFDLADVQNKTYAGTQPGWVLTVGTDGQSLVLTPTSTASRYGYYSQTSFDSTTNQTGLSLQQYLCQTWVDITSTVTGTAFAGITSVAYGKGIFVAVGYDSSGNPLVKYSSVVLPFTIDAAPTTLSNWTDIPTNPFTLPAGQTPLPLFGVRYFDNKFFAFGAGGTIATSLDGINWSLQTRNLTGDFFSLAWGPSVGYVIVGTTGGHYGTGVAYFSTDGFTWSAISNPLGNGLIADPTLTTYTRGDSPLYGIHYGNDRFVAVGGLVYSTGNQLQYSNVPHIAYSTDGKSWTVSTSALPLSAHYTAQYANGIWVVGTNSQQVNTSDPNYGLVLQYSVDNAVTWQTSTVWKKSNDTGVDGNLQGMTYGNGLFLGSNQYPNFSVDGLNWYRTYPPSPWPGTGDPTEPGTGTTGAYGNGIFVLGSRYGDLIRSSLVGEVFGSGSSGGGGPAIAIQSQLFTTPGTTTWQAPSSVTKVRVTVVGGGGGSGNFPDAIANGGNGGIAVGIVNVTPGSNYSVVVGAGGAGQVNTGGGDIGYNGGTSSFASLSATGGTGNSWAYMSPLNPATGQVIYAPDGTGSGGSLVNSSVTANQPTILWPGNTVNNNNSAVPASAAYGVGKSGIQQTTVIGGGIGGMVYLEYIG